MVEDILQMWQKVEQVWFKVLSPSMCTTVLYLQNTNSNNIPRVGFKAVVPSLGPQA